MKRDIYKLLLPVVEVYSGIIENIGREIKVPNKRKLNKNAKILKLRVIRNKSFHKYVSFKPEDPRKFRGTRKDYKPVDVVSDFVYWCIQNDKLDYILEKPNFLVLKLFFEEYIKPLINMETMYENLEDLFIYEQHLKMLKENE